MIGSELGVASSGKVQAMIERLDPAIFAIDSETSANDRVSLLRLQRFVRRHDDAYCYFEIGSHLGGSLLTHLADPRCAWAISVDSRPARLADERGRFFEYRENSTARMIAVLQTHLPSSSLRKLQTFDLDAAEVPHGKVRRRVRLLLIDGEHTNPAAFSDFLSVFPLLADEAVIAFHDANLVASGIQNVERFLAYAAVPSRTVFLPDNVAAIGLRGLGEQLVGDIGEVALRRGDFLAASRKWVWTNRAAEMLLNGELNLPEVTGIAASRFKGIQDRLTAIESHPLYRATRPVRALLLRMRGK